MNVPWLFFAAALLAGTLITVQTGSNARLKEAFGEAMPAVIVSSSLGIILLFAVRWPAGFRGRQCRAMRERHGGDGWEAR